MMDDGHEAKGNGFNWKKRFRNIEEINFPHITRVHPCFNVNIHPNIKTGRIHLPVSPECNIQCNFCVRSFNKVKFRPGVASQILSPSESIRVLQEAIEMCPEIAVVGIAGPGDPLATDHAFKTLTLVDKHFPHLIKCFSTNGLKLEGKAEEFAELGVRTVTVSIHAVNPRIGAKIYSHARINGKLLYGIDASGHLIRAQLAGIEEAVKSGLVVKVNTVLIPGINQDHIEAVAEAVHLVGASMINIIPLIPQYKLSHVPPPTCEQLRQARGQAEHFLPVFRHCQRCRADAVGILGGKDITKLLYGASPVPSLNCIG